MTDAIAVAQRQLAAVAIARQAGELMRRLFVDRAGIELSFKGPQDYLTQADAAVERLVRERLAEAFPEDQFYGEETGGSFGDSVWVVDPIDGTANFARGIPHFCVSIAYARNRVPTIGAIYNPMTDEMFEARRGHGAHFNGKRMKASTVSDLKLSQVELGWSSRRSAADYGRMLRQVLDAGASFRRGGSGALGVAYVADGRSDGYAELHINSWDCLAGIVMVTEAGGWVNDFLAGDGMSKGNPVLATAPGLRDAMIRATGIGADVVA
ncbi:MAG: inositol monophosphatase [Alphaproteobacteria bacterium]|nr:inositol monophosphatase [Alphaproteobacteria bacterium]